MVDGPDFCPYCGEAILEALPDIQLVAINLPNAKVLPTAKSYRCAAWHVFAVFPKQLQPGEGTEHKKCA
jgi:hypothetical protein